MFVIENDGNKSFVKKKLWGPFVNFQNHQNIGTQTSITVIGYLK
jgi:hypothetical protein